LGYQQQNLAKSGISNKQIFSHLFSHQLNLMNFYFKFLSNLKSIAGFLKEKEILFKILL